jgi:hypothetical protein
MLLVSISYLSLSEGLALVLAGSMGNESSILAFDGNVIHQGDVLDLNVLKGPFAEKLHFCCGLCHLCEILIFDVKKCVFVNEEFLFYNTNPGSCTCSFSAMKMALLSIAGSRDGAREHCGLIA